MIDFAETNQKRSSKPMKDITPKLTQRDVLEHAQQRLQKHLNLKADGHICNAQQLVHILRGPRHN